METLLRFAVASLGLLLLAGGSSGQAAGLDLPMMFIEAPDGTGDLVSRFGPFRMRAEQGGLSVMMLDRSSGSTQVIRLGFEGLDDAKPVGIESLSARVHMLRGRDRADWRQNLAAYRGVSYRDPSSGVTWEFRARNGRLDMHVESSLGLSVSTPALRLESAGISTIQDGRLEFLTSVGSLRFDRPVLDRGQSAERSGAWTVEGQAFLRVETDSTVTPTTADWATYIGGMFGDTCSDTAIGADALITVVGNSNSPDFPTTPGAYQPDFEPFQGFDDAIVVRLDPVSQELVFATFVSGTNSDDEFYRVVVLENGDSIIAGRTSATDFPVTEEAFDQTKAGVFDAVVCRLTADGSDLVYSTLLGGDGGGPTDQLTSLVVTEDERIIVAGFSSTQTYPTTPGVFQPEPSDDPRVQQSDGVVSILSPTASTLIASTFLGAGPNGRDEILGLALDDDGSIVVVGRTDSAEFPITGDALDPTYNGGTDAFVARLNPDLSTLLSSTYLGTPQFDLAADVKIGPGGILIVGGETKPPGFPTTHDAFLLEPLFDIFSKCFLTKLSPSGREILYSTYLGGFGTESAPLQLEVDSVGAVTIAGRTVSIGGFPVTPGSFQQENANISEEAFVLRLHPDGHSMLYGSYLGGSDDEFPTATSNTYIGLAMDPFGNAAIAVETTSDDFPTTAGTYDPDFNGSTDGALTFLSMLPKGVTRFGSSTPDLDGPVVLGVLSMPYPGNATFGITTTNAPPAGDGWLALASTALVTPLDLAGAQLWLDPASLLGIARVTANELGWSQARLALPDDPALVGVQAYAQSFWPLPGAPGLLASDALTVTVQQAPEL